LDLESVSSEKRGYRNLGSRLKIDKEIDGGLEESKTIDVSRVILPEVGKSDNQ